MLNDDNASLYCYMIYFSFMILVNFEWKTLTIPFCVVVVASGGRKDRGCGVGFEATFIPSEGSEEGVEG